MSEQEVGHQYEDSDYIGYGYNIHQFNQLTEGSFFLYRRPARLSPDRKFHIYGGGIVKTISKPDLNGNVTARIIRGFEFDSPISQGDPFIESYSWKTRNKPGPGWKGFWLNYGMNEIDADDFWYLVKGRTCRMDGNQLSEIQTVEENESISCSSLESGFVINLNDSSFTSAVPSTSRVSLAKKIDFTALSEQRKTIGTAGELIVLEYENERLAKKGIAKGLENIGYDVEKSKKKNDKIRVPVLFGTNGQVNLAFEVDGYCKKHQTVIEVEAGRAVINYQFLKDFYEACMMQDVRFFCVAVKNKYRAAKDFEKVCNFFQALYVSNRMGIPLEGILVIGY